MKAISITQPWAALILRGLKRYETRCWRTPYRGPLAIHAPATLPHWARIFATQNGIELEGLPLGAVVGTAVLADIIPSEEARLYLPRAELALGWYGDGRWAWKLENITALPEPVPARGHLGVWDWQVNSA